MSRNMPGPNRYRDELGDLWIDGRAYLGRVRVPPLPNRIGLVDRETGQTRVLSHSGTPGTLAIDLVSPNARMSDLHTYGPYEGPYFEGFRIYLSNGTLLAEPAVGYGSSKILTRRGNDKIVLHIKVSSDGVVYASEYQL